MWIIVKHPRPEKFKTPFLDPSMEYAREIPSTWTSDFVAHHMEQFKQTYKNVELIDVPPAWVVKGFLSGELKKNETQPWYKRADPGWAGNKSNVLGFLHDVFCNDPYNYGRVLGELNAGIGDWSTFWCKRDFTESETCVQWGRVSQQRRHPKTFK